MPGSARARSISHCPCVIYTRAIVTATDEGILLKPVTAAIIDRGFGLLKRKPGDKPLAEEWAERKREEHQKEEANYAHHGSR